MKNVAKILTVLMLMTFIACKKQDVQPPANAKMVSTTTTTGTKSNTYKSVKVALYAIVGSGTGNWAIGSNIIGDFYISVNGVDMSVKQQYIVGDGTSGLFYSIGELKTGDVVSIKFDAGLISMGKTIAPYDTITEPTNTSYMVGTNAAKFLYDKDSQGHSLTPLKFVEFADTTAAGYQTAVPTVYNVKIY